MNAALWFLFWRLTLRKTFRWLGALRQPGRALGVLICLSGLSLLFYYRNAHGIRELVERTPLWLVLLLAVPLSLIRGLMQRGMNFDPPEIEYLCSRPFRQRAVLVYRLIPSYLSALGVGVGVYLLLGHHFVMPGVVATCVVLTHVLSIHLTLKASLFGATLTDRSLRQMRRGLWLIVFVTLYAAFRWGTGMERVPVSEQIGLRYFLSAVGLLGTMDSSVLVRAVMADSGMGFGAASVLMIPNSSFLLFGLVFALGVLVPWSFVLLLPKGIDLYEPSLRKVAGSSSKGEANSVRWRRVAWATRVVQAIGVRRYSNGFLALWWKNFLCARRSVPSLLLGLGYTLLLVVPWLLLVATMYQAGVFVSG